MQRGRWSGVAALGGVGAVGLGVWTWFLAGRSLEVMDQWASVVSSFGTLVSLLVAIVAVVLASPGSGAGGRGAAGRVPGGRRSVRAKGDISGSVTAGDHSPINERDR